MAAPTKRRGVFLDLGGTIVLPIRVESPDEYRRIPRAAEAIRRLNRAGFVCPVVTVQSGIGKGRFTEAAFRAWFRNFAGALAAEGAMVEGPYVCPHRYAEACGCKKPTGALYRSAAVDFDVDLAASVIVGDSIEDIEAARTLGCRSVAVRTGCAVDRELEHACDYAADDVMGAAEWITAPLADSPRGR